MSGLSVSELLRPNVMNQIRTFKQFPDTVFTELYTEIDTRKKNKAQGSTWMPEGTRQGKHYSD